MQELGRADEPLIVDDEVFEEDAFQELDDLLEPEPLDPESTDFVHRCVTAILRFSYELAGHDLFPYQEEFGYRLVESIVINDGADLTALFSRQSGKTETVADILAALMILLPKLALMYPEWFGRYEQGFLVGTFAPVESQAETLFERIRSRLTSDAAKEVLADPEIADKVEKNGARLIELKSGSLCRMQTANPKANIESKSYHCIVVDEAQDADDKKVKKSIRPMGAFYNATVVMTGTPTYTKGVFYDTIMDNKRRALRRNRRQNHFQHDWRSCARYNPDYAKYVAKEKALWTEESDEFQLSYALKWLLEQGMFTTEERLEQLGDISMQQLVKSWKRSPVIIGIDPARKKDSTVVTALWVDWSRPDEDGFYDMRILNWLELHGERWEEQYGRIVDFCGQYNVKCVGIDGQGMGDVIADRLARLMPRTRIIALGSDNAAQSLRWKHLMQIMDKGLIGWPAGARVRRTRLFARFIQQMRDLEKAYKGKYLLAAAPNKTEAHDDYPDSLAIAAILTREDELDIVEESDNFFYARGAA